MKRMFLYILPAILLLVLTTPADAQLFRRNRNSTGKQRAAARLDSVVRSASARIEKSGYVMNFVVVGTDTFYVDELPPAIVNPREKMTRTEWEIYYKRVHNFSKAYPYALLVSSVIDHTENIFETEHYTRRQKERYLNDLKEDLLNEFEPIFRKLTLSQGLMMIRLIDRECGMTPYYILKDYLGAPAAGFWQGVAKIFKGDLKQPYDRFGEDKDLEELVGYWERGDFDYLYRSIFGRNRPEIYIPQRFR